MLSASYGSIRAYSKPLFIELISRFIEVILALVKPSREVYMLTFVNLICVIMPNINQMVKILLPNLQE